MGAPTTAMNKQFQDAITLLAQQLESRMRGAVMTDTNWVGEEKYYDQYASDTMVEIVSRLQATPQQDPDHRRRRVTPRYFVSSTIEDPNEAMAMLVDPKSAYMQAKRAAMARKYDEIIISALGGTAYTGKAGATEVTLGAAQKITSQAAGMNLAKLLVAKETLDAAEVDKEGRFVVLAAGQIADLLNVSEVKSADYNTIKALAMGDIDTFMGFKFIQSEQLAVDGSSDRLCYAFQKKGIQLAIQKEGEARVDERKDLNYAWQVWVKIALGATRLEEARVFQMACVE